MRRLLRVVAVCAAALLVPVSLGAEAGATKVANPGSIVLKGTAGTLQMGTQYVNLVSVLPECSDGLDNDGDGRIDFPADTSCTSELDNSELVGGFQPRVEPSFTGTVDANGNIAIPASGVVFPLSWINVGGYIVQVRILPTHDATGSIDPTTGAMTLRVRLRVRLESGELGLGDTCFVGSVGNPIDAVLSTGNVLGAPYNRFTGSAVLGNDTFGVPGATGCGFLGILDQTINDAAGLPSPSGRNSIQLAGVITPAPQPPAAVANQAPTAVINASALSGAAPLTVNFSGTGSSDPDGSVVAYLWDLGNGSTPNTPTASTTYTAAGTYSVRLTVTDDKGATNEATVTVTVSAPVNQPPTAQMTANPTTGQAPLAVNFSSAGSVDPDGTIAAYSWNFGDGTTASGATVNKTYTAAGSYTARLTVTDNKGATGTVTTTITVTSAVANQPPSAALTATPTSGQAPLAVAFSGTGSTDPDGTIASYAWNFGDGTSGTGATVNKTYTAAGSYTAKLTVTDNQGATAEATTTITVTAPPPPNQAPTAKVTATPTSGTAPLAVAFDGTGSTDPDGTIASYAWNFGDGTSGTGATVNKTYTNPGNYTARLTVTDNAGATAQATVAIVVAAVPGAADHVSVRLTGGLVYSNSGTLTSGDFIVNRDQNGVAAVGGRGTLPGTSTGDAVVAVSLTRLWILDLWYGSVAVTDRAAGISTSAPFFGSITKGSTITGSASWFSSTFQPYTLTFSITNN